MTNTSSWNCIRLFIQRFPNTLNGFNELFFKIQSVTLDLSKTKVSLGATGHYCYNLLRFLLDKGLTTHVINSLHTNLCQRSLLFCKTKTDKVDSRTIAFYANVLSRPQTLHKNIVSQSEIKVTNPIQI